MNLSVKKHRAPVRMVEMVRSFTFKLNLGNYESADFFQSAKTTCREDEAEEVSEMLHQFCKAQVLKSANEIRKDGINGTRQAQ
jgi:hypothetical protein